MYFPGIDFSKFTEEEKDQIEIDIKKDFDHAYIGIQRLPKGARLGVYLAYKYYLNLYKKIKTSSAEKVQKERIRVPDTKKVYLLFSSTLRNSLNIL